MHAEILEKKKEKISTLLVFLYLLLKRDGQGWWLFDLVENVKTDLMKEEKKIYDEKTVSFSMTSFRKVPSKAFTKAALFSFFNVLPIGCCSHCWLPHLNFTTFNISFIDSKLSFFQHIHTIQCFPRELSSLTELFIAERREKFFSKNHFLPFDT